MGCKEIGKRKRSLLLFRFAGVINKHLRYILSLHRFDSGIYGNLAES
jgi:hypothetical protein